nr:Morn repeat protein [Pandoravirus massiliensis]
MRKRLCVREPVDEDAHATQGGLFALLPDELVIEVMAFCEPRSLARLACASVRLAGLAADGGLWRRLYARAFPPCTRLGLACMGDAIDAWHFAPDDGSGIDGLDHGPAAGDMRLENGRRQRGDAPNCSDGPQDDSHSGGAADQHNVSRHTKQPNQVASLSRWWNLRCARLTRLAADRVTGSGLAPAHAGCRHVPTSLVRARGYRWAYAMSALAPLVRKTRYGAGHVHRIVHRGAPNGLAVQCELCLAPGHTCCSVVWRWGRFGDCFLSGLGTEVASHTPRLDQDARGRHPHQHNNGHTDAGGFNDNNNDNNNNGGMPQAFVVDEATTTAIAGLWSDGVPHGPHVRRDANGEIVIGAASDPIDPPLDDLMDEDRHPPPARLGAIAIRGRYDDDDDNKDDGDDDTSVAVPTGTHMHTPSVIYYAVEDLAGGAWSYEGERLGGRRDGYGALLCEALAAPTYEGDWRRDSWHGRGVLRGRDGAKVFEGRFVRGRPCGRGALYLHDGVRVEASWHTLPDGVVAPRHIGHVVYANGDRVLCDWGRPKAAGADGARPGSVTVRGFRFADDAPARTQREAEHDPPSAMFAGREVGAEWGAWPTECAADPSIVDVRSTVGPLPAQSGVDPAFCERAWRVTLPAVFWPPMDHPLESLFARYVDEDRIGWRGYRTRTPRVTGPADPCAL